MQRWVNRFEQIGFTGLHEGERPGRPSRLSDEQWQGLEGDLRRSPREFGFEQTLWDGICWPSICVDAIGLSWVCVNVSVCSDRWAFGCANRVP
ncbi:MAG: hypothetical protein ACREYE_16020 [Gammaproteobacteria bacterium]